MPLPTVLITSALAGLAALGLTPWLGRVAEVRSRLLALGLHVALAVCGGAGAAALADGAWELLAYAVLALACAVLVPIDLAVLRLPDPIVLPSYPVFFGLLAAAAATSDTWGRLGRAALAGLLLLAGYFVLAYLSPRNLGLGDVKLAGLLGGFLGWLGWPQVLLGALAGFGLSGVLAGILVVGGGAQRATAYPFGPLMIGGAVLGAGFGPTLLGP